MQEENLTEQKARLRSRAVCVVIPTYNNAGTILNVVRRSLVQCDDVIVVCDGCTDSTVELLSSLSGNVDILEFKGWRCGRAFATHDRGDLPMRLLSTLTDSIFRKIFLQCFKRTSIIPEL